ncbi:ExeM/NucH family extracellular endonuclease, partial [Raphidiopsis sp. BLCC-F218]
MSSILFVDPRIPDCQSLIKDPDPNLGRVVVIDPNRDGIVQITETLKLGSFDTVHIVSHGTAGSLYFGTTVLNSSTLPTYSNLLGEWSGYLTARASVLLYGCNVAQGDSGKNFINQLHKLIGVDIAASDDATGSVILGGDWDLEYSTGLITAPLAFQIGVMDAYNSVLAPFTAGNLVVYRVGSGTGNLVNTGNPVFLDEYTPTGTLVQSIPIPTTSSGTNSPLIASGTATSEGLLSLSTDGKYLLLTGYGRTTGGTGSLSGTTGANTPRVVGRVDASGNIDTTTALTDFANTNNPRSVTSNNGTDLWVAGGAGGVRYTTLGSTTSVDLSSTTFSNVRQLNIFNDQLYASSGSNNFRGVETVGTGLPITGPQTITRLAGLTDTTNPSTYAFFLADLSPSITGVDTLYVADDGLGALSKFSLVGGNWVANGKIGEDTDDYRGLTASVSGTTVTLFATRKGGSGPSGGGELVTLTDASGYNSSLTGNITLLATAGANTAFRGVAFAPANISTPTVNLSVSSTSSAEASQTAITVTATASSAVSGNQTVNLGVTGIGITSNDYLLTGSIITIPSGSNTGSVTFTIVDDALVEDTETATLTISNPSSGLTLGTITSQNITITDNDTPGIIVAESAGSTNITEGGATDTYTVVLATQPASEVTITISPNAQLTTNTSNLAFTTANWNQSQTVSVTAIDDIVVEGNHTGTITHSVSSSDNNYNGISAASVTANITDNDVAITKISAIQGSGTAAALTGTQTIEGIVTRTFQGSTKLNGFYVQEEDVDADSNATTSEAIFVYDPSSLFTGNVGDKVRITGTVSEYTTTSGGNTSSLTQISNLTSVINLGASTLPTITNVQLPVTNVNDLERYEGMLVNISGASGNLTVTENYQLGRYGQVILAVDGPSNQPGTDARLDQYTQFNSPNVSGYTIYRTELAKRRIYLDDGSSTQNLDPILFGRGSNPLSATNTLRSGDTVGNITGILDQRFEGYRIQTSSPVNFNASNPRPATPPNVGGTLKVASFNLLNYFNDLDTTPGSNNGPNITTNGLTFEPRGANTSTEFTRQRDKIINAIVTSKADVIGLMEMENNGFGDSSAIQDLVNGLNAVAGAGTYAFINPGVRLGSDAINVGLVYKSGKVTPVGAAATTPDAYGTGAFDLVGRKPLAQTFSQKSNGATFTVVVNHFKSKGSSSGGEGDADAGDGQGLSNGTRTRQSQDLGSWLATKPTGTNDPDYLLIGDFNAYAKEDPITTLSNLGYKSTLPTTSYSYVFDGQVGSLDHALATDTIAAQITGADDWHINTDEPSVLDYNTDFKSTGQVTNLYNSDFYRSSDHDPLLVGLNLTLNNITGVDLSRYVRVGRYDLPEPTRTSAPTNSLLAQEASAVTYNWDTDTLFVTGDGGTSIVQISKTGQLIDSMTLAPGGSPQGTDFYDTEGLTYIGDGKFVLVEERDRQANLFTYIPGSILGKSGAQVVKLGTTVGNIGLEGVSYDPLTNGFIFVKEKTPQSIFQTTIDFSAGNASNGSATTTNSTNLFNPDLANLADFSDVFALSNLPSLKGQADYSRLLVISQESGQIINVDRSGSVSSKLTIVADPGSLLTVPDMTMEGVTMDWDGNLYVVNENGGNNANRPQLWVYAPSTATNLAPTLATLINPVTSIPENTSTAAPIRVADLGISDDGLGTNNLSITGADASSFQIIGNALYLKTGTSLSATTKPSYNVTVNVDDPSVGNTPDTSVNYTLAITSSTGGTPSLIISEVAPWSSGSSPVAADWFEVTNVGTAAQDITGWKMDDNSNSFGASVALNGITSIAPGESVIFIETGNGQTAAGNASAFRTLWFGTNPPTNLKIGSYGGSGVGLSTGGDAVNLYNSAGVTQAKVTFGTSPNDPFPTFNNALGLNDTTISTLSAVGINGAFTAPGDTKEIGSPGTIGSPTAPVVSIVATDANAAEPGKDPGTFRITRTGSTVGSLIVNYTVTTGAGQATAADYSTTLTGVVTILSGESFVDVTITPVNDTVIEGNETVTLTLGDTGSYDVGTPATATVIIADNSPASISGTATGGVKEGNNVVGGKLTVTGSLSITDADAGQNKFSTTVASASSNLGSLTISETGLFTYTVDNSAVQYLGTGQTKVETFTVNSIDGSASQTITITINGVTAGFTAVASGNAASDRAIVWTRTYDTATASTQPGITQNITLQVATDNDFKNIVKTFDSATRGATNDYTVKIDATGLESATRYYYRFRTASGEVSQTGTFKTAPDATVAASVKFAFSGDADGLMRPYPSTANFPNLNLDYFIFLGDTIYSAASNGSPAAVFPVTDANADTALIDYHRKYLENIKPVNPGGFAGLQTLFASQGNYTLLDNHELGNRQLINGGAPAALASNSSVWNNSGSSNSNDDVNNTGAYINETVPFTKLIQAYLNYQPIREQGIISAPNDPRTDGTQKLYFSQKWGKNSIFVNVDDRSYRDVRLKSSGNTDNTGDRADNPNRTMLGTTQLQWLKDTLLAAQSDGTVWKFIAVSSPIDQIGAIPTGVGLGLDGGKSWVGGYRAERNDLLKFIADNGIKNVVFLSTDDHQNRINELTYVDNNVVKTLPNAFSIVAGPIGATGPDGATLPIFPNSLGLGTAPSSTVINDHSFTSIKTYADSLAAYQITNGLNPVGLAANFPGLKNVYREGDVNADTNRTPFDFISPDTFNYAVFNVSADGSVLTVEVQGINSYPINTFPEPSVSNPVRSILSFQVDAASNPPTAVSLTNTTPTIAENTSTTNRIKVGDINITDDALGTETITLTGADATSFEVDGNALYLKAGTVLNHEIKSSYLVTVNVDDTTVGNTPDVSTNFTLTITDVNETPTITSATTATFAENGTGTAYTVLATDPDAGTTLTYSLSGTDAARFNINSTTGAVTFTTA